MVSKTNISILLSSLLLIILIYSGAVKLPKDSLTALIPEKEVSSFTGKIISNPVKSSDSYYTAKIKFNSVSSDKISSSANGVKTVLIPVKIIEAFYPGKLYSRNNSDSKLIPLEQGVIITCTVNSFLNKDGEASFILKKINESYFEKGFSGFFYRLRALCRIQFKRLMMLWGSAGGFLLALLSGSKEYLDGKLISCFRMSGLSHILALSGMHLSLISSLAGVVENKSALKKAGLFIRVLTIIIFVWFAGLSPSLLRALISVLIVSLCTLIHIPKINSLVLLCTTFLIHTVVCPDDLFNLAFLFSYSALAGILILSGMVKSLLSGFIPSAAVENLSASIGANIFTTPISLKVFGYFSPGGIISTLVVSPVITVFLYMGIVLLTLSLCFPAFAVLAGSLMNVIYWFISKMVEFWSFIPQVSF